MGTIGRRSRLVGRIAAVGMVLGLSALLVGAWAGPAGAHEGRQVGRYRFVVGFGDEPVYAGQKNSVQLLLSDGRGRPGDYRAFFIPSTPGTYTFHFHGTIAGQKVEQDFTSGPKTFGNVQDPAQAAFPKLNQPSNAQIAQRLDRETARLDSAAGASERRMRETSGRVTVLSILGPFGLLLGLFGMVMTGIALKTAKRALAASSRPPVPFQDEAARSRVEV